MNETTATLQCTCPHCGQQLTIPAQYAGQQGMCRHCNNAFVAPAQEQSSSKPKGRRKSLIFAIVIIILMLGFVGDWRVAPRDVEDTASPSTIIEEHPLQQTEPIALYTFGTDDFVSTSPIEQANRYNDMAAEELYDQLEKGMTFSETLRILGNPQVLDSRHFLNFSVDTQFEWWIAPRYRLMINFSNDKIIELELRAIDAERYALEQFLYNYRQANPTAPVHEGALVAIEQGYIDPSIGNFILKHQMKGNVTIICPQEDGITTRTGVRFMREYQSTEGYGLEVYAKAYPHRIFSHWKVSPPGSKKTGNPLLIKDPSHNIIIEAVFKERDSEFYFDSSRAFEYAAQSLRQVRHDMNLEEVEQIMHRLEPIVDGIIEARQNPEGSKKRYAYSITDDVRLVFIFVRGKLKRIENQHINVHPVSEPVIVDKQNVTFY